MTAMARKIAVTVAGLTVVAIGVALFVLPIPGTAIVVILGLAILATEFLWAGKLIDQLRKLARQLKAHALQLLSK